MKHIFLILLALIAWLPVWSYKTDGYAAGNDVNRLNTAVNASYLTNLEKEIILEINMLRSDPASYAEKYIVPLKKCYKKNYLHYPGDLPLPTREGASALNECVHELIKCKPLPLVFPSIGLSKAAGDHVRDQGRSGQTGHTGSDRSGFRARIERYGSWNIRIAENIAYGGITARQIVIYLLIDDGIKDRGHRKNFLHREFRAVGVSEGTHPVYKRMTVMDFAGAYTDK